LNCRVWTDNYNNTILNLKRKLNIIKRECKVFEFLSITLEISN